MSVAPVDNSNNPLVSQSDEMLLHICSFLPGVALTQLAQTCNAFARVSREESFWKAETERTFTATHNPDPKDWKQEYVSLVKQALGDTIRIVAPQAPPQELANNKTFMLQAVKQNGSALKFASEELRNDREFILEAVKQNGYALECASKELQNDSEIVLEAVKQNSYALQFASKELRNDREFIIEAVKQKGDALEHASKELRNDSEIVLEAVKQHGYALNYASEELQNDSDFVLEATH